MNTRVAVVIPFFQRGKGIVRKAVESILDQRYSASEIIIVDDCSPVPAIDELKDLRVDRGDLIRIVMMDRNSGQGAARNKGLSSVALGTEYVAFLDSDDEWTPDHLENAVRALNQGYDFYFSDFYQLHQNVTAFNRAKRIDPANHRTLPGTPHLHVFEADMSTQILQGNILGMSTIVYRIAKFPAVRFREDFRSTGEEYLFWMTLSRLTNQIAFSSAAECTYGEGVNTYSGATWGRKGAMRRVHDEIRYLLAIKNEFALTPEQQRLVTTKLKTLRTDFVREVLHELSRFQYKDANLAWGVARMDPLCVPMSVPITLGIVGDWVKGRMK